MKRVLKTLSVFLVCVALLAPRAAWAQISAADAAPYVGSWILKMDGPMGPAEMTLKITADGGKVVGEMAASDQLPATKSSDASGDAKGLTLKFTLAVQGMDIPATIKLTPDGAKFKAVFDVMDGQYTMSGVGTKS